MLALAGPSIAPGQVGISVDGVAGEAGDEITFNVLLSVDGPAVVATQNELQFPQSITVVSCRVNDAIGKDASLFTYLPQGCQRGFDCTGVRALVFSLSDSNPIPDASVLYTCTARIDTDALPGRSTIDCSEALASTADATPLPASCPAAPVVVVRVADVTIVVGGATAAPGQQAIFDVAIAHHAAPAGTQNDLRFPSQARVRSCSLNRAINKDSSRFVLLPQGCTPGLDCTGVRALVFSFDDTSTIPSGAVLYSCRVDIDAGTALGSVLPIACEDSGASEADATQLDTECRDGAISVVDPVVSLDLGRVAVASGERAVVPLFVHILNDDVAIIAVQTELRVSQETSIAAAPDGTPDCSTGVSGDAFQALSFQPSGCQAGLDCTSVRAAVIRSPAAPIADGTAVFQCTFEIRETLGPGSYPIRHVPGSQLATDSAGAFRGATTTDGEIVVRSACVGDCNADQRVPVSELLTGVNMLLGLAPTATCSAFDRDLNGLVTVDELVTAIGEALRGCGE